MKKMLFVIFILIFQGLLFSKNIAVMPFQNITGDKEKNWIGAGFSETITIKLTKVKEINVLEREQLSKILEELKFQVSDVIDEKTAVEQGKIYGADVLVLGSFQVMVDKIKVTAKFVDVETAKVIDTAESEGNISNIFKIQNKIAFRLLDRLNIILDKNEKEEIQLNPTKNIIAYQWHSKGYEAVNMKRYNEAIEDFTKAIVIDPKFTVAYINRAVAYFRKGLYDEGIKDYTKAIEINPNDTLVYCDRAVAYFQKGLYDEAIKDFIKAIEINPNDTKIYIKRGIIYDNKGLYDKAIEDYTKAIEINPKEANAYDMRGITYSKKGLYDKAIEDYTKVIKLNPNGENTYIMRGDTYIHKGLYDKAIEDYTKGIEINPKKAMAYSGRGYSYFYKGLYDEAIKDCTKAIEIDPKFAESWYNKACCLSIKSQKNSMLFHLKQAIKLDNKCKEQAKIDEDFRKYWDDIDFEQLVK